MPRPKNAVPSYRHHKPSGRARCAAAPLPNAAPLNVAALAAAYLAHVEATGLYMKHGKATSEP